MTRYNLALHDADKTKFPNLALMKLSAYFKSRGHAVSWYDPTRAYDGVCSSKIFTFTEDDNDLISDAKKGGAGYRCFENLPDAIEHITPDYSLYDLDYSLGFLTRGCSRKCPWCIVPQKEGMIKAHADIEEFLKHDRAVLMDNNVLASEHGIAQIEKIIKLGVKVDFNQGLDSRLIDDPTARLLSKVKWSRPLRLACDTAAQMPVIQKAVARLRWYNTRPINYTVYCLVKDIDEALERIKFLKGIHLEPFAQPFIDYDNNVMPTQLQKDFARWVNHRAIFRSVQWEDYDQSKRNR